MESPDKFILNTEAYKKDNIFFIHSEAPDLPQNKSIAAQSTQSTQFNDVKPNYLQSDLNSVS